MNILIISNIELDERNACGNTFSNWLTNWEGDTIYSIYSRDSIPNNNFCQKYLSISAFSIIKNIFCVKRIGKIFNNDLNKDISKRNTNEQHLINYSKKNFSDFLYVINDILYSSRIWQNKKYKDFINEIQPDIVFYFAKSEAFIYQNLKYIKKYTKAKLIAFYADDMYSMYKNGGGLRNHIFQKRFLKLVRLADKNYGASELMCNTYAKKFGLTLSPLYKGCAISAPKNTVNKPIKIVYAGNLYYGRGDVLAKIALSLNRINVTGTKGILEIYSGTKISEQLTKQLNIEGTSKFMGERPFSEILSILKNADIVLHVESFLQQNMDIVRLSYSTKISDCLQSGSMMLVIGPNGVASVEEAKLIDGAVIINEEANIHSRLESLLSHPIEIAKRAKITNEIAKQKFPIEKVRRNLRNDFLHLLNQK